ncbi:VirB4 family type IV secretion system protein [Anaerorhabdus sp.]|uniref:VirB4 family type IV secretion system protein n=1 Tax=Anaerorhabdus sp. TaxID=1872524 RepID=UPI002FCAB437
MKLVKQESTNTLLKYKVLEDGIINENKDYVGMIKIFPVNLFAMSIENQDKYLDSLFHIVNMQLVKSMQFFSTDIPIEIKEFIEQLDDLQKYCDLENEQQKKQYEALEVEKNRLATLTLEQEIIDQTFYIIYTAQSKADLDNKTVDFLRQFQQSYIPFKLVDEREKIKVIYRYFNPYRATYEKYPRSFGKEFDINDYLKIENISFRNEGKRTYFVSDNLFHMILYVAGYPTKPGIGYLSGLMSIRGCDTSVHMLALQSSKVTRQLDIQADNLKSGLDNAKTMSKSTALNVDIEDINDQIFNVVAQNINASTLFTTIHVKETSLEGLFERVQLLKEQFGKKLFILREGFAEQLELFKTNSPLGTSYYDATYSKEVTCDAISDGFPFIQEMSVDKIMPIFLGKTESGGPVFYDAETVNETRLNRNEFLSGTSGSGKTTLLLNFMQHRFARRVKQFILDVEGNQLKNWAIDNKGNIVNCADGSEGMINPLQIRVEYQSSGKESSEEELSKKFPLAMHFVFLRDFFKTLYGEEATDTVALKVKYLEILLRELYKRFGFTYESTAADIRKVDNKDFPIFTDLYNVAKDLYHDPSFISVPKDKFQELMLDIENLANGPEATMFNGYSTVDLEKNLITLFDLSSFNNSTNTLLQLHIFNILTFIWGFFLSNQDESYIRVYIDELSVILKNQNVKLIDMLDSFIKRVRKFNGGVTTATQKLNDVYRIEGADSLIGETQYKFVFHVDGPSLELLSRMGEYREEDIKYIAPTSRGKCLMSVGNTVLHIINEVDAVNLQYFDSLKNKG